ncbi:MAG: sugar ABC transporter substrate-binding protein [Paenibacillaceae bacterium]|jgi:raffinose/stachyose/melibiose transport system substrate-binding protein|nr:MAG: sugar ABC transporter substrate-binding protein [Paenibacillaceae bacterium]
MNSIIKRKKQWLALMMAAVLLALAACGGGGNKNSGSSNGQGGSGSSAEPGGSEAKTELTLWNIWTDPSAEHQSSLKQVEKFMAEHPDIIIKQQNIPHDQYKVKLKAQAAGRELPDLMQVWPGAELAPLVQGGLLQPIDDIVSHWDGLVIKEYLKDYSVDGKVYAIPAQVVPTHVIYYDKDQLAEAGYETFPATYEEFKALIQKLKDKGLIPITLGNKGQWVLQSVYISTIGDRLTGSDFLHDVLETRERKFTDPEFVRALEIVKELVDLGAFNEDFNTIDNDQQREYFINGEAAMMIDGSWGLGPVLEAAPDKNVGVAVFPAVDGGLGDPNAVSVVSGMGIALNVDLQGEKLEAAQTFLKGFYTEEYFREMLKASILVPADIEAPAEVSPVLMEVAELAGKKVAPVYDATLPLEITDIINAGLQELSIGFVTPEELAKKLQDAVENRKA